MADASPARSRTGKGGGEGPELLSDLEAARCMAEQKAREFYLWTAVRPSCFIRFHLE